MNCKVTSALFIEMNKIRKTQQSSWNDLIAYLIQYADKPLEYQRDYKRKYEGKLQFFTLRFHESDWIKFAEFSAYFRNYPDLLDYLVYGELNDLFINKKIGF